MNRVVRIIICCLLLTSCSKNIEPDDPLENEIDFVDQMTVEEYKSRIERLESENGELRGSLEELEETENELWLKIKEVQLERDSLMEHESSVEDRETLIF